MSISESSATLRITTTLPSTGPHLRVVDGAADRARALLICTITKELRLGTYVAGWLRALARRVADDMPELSAECVRLAVESAQLREELVALAYRLVARRNRGLGQRRVNVMSLLELPPSGATRSFIEVNEATVRSDAPWTVLAVIARVEELQAFALPLSVELSTTEGDERHDDLVEAAAHYQARQPRAQTLRRLLDALVAEDPTRAELLREAGERGAEIFNTITRETAERSEQLGDWHDGVLA
jgi:hypothetical protein